MLRAPIWPRLLFSRRFLRLIPRRVRVMPCLSVRAAIVSALAVVVGLLLTPAISHGALPKLLDDVKYPPEFEASIFAAPPQVNYPVFVAAAPDGTVYVSSDKNGSVERKPNRGSVVRLRDRDGDGRADEARAFVTSVDSPRGLVWDHDRIYLMHPPHLSAFIDRNGDGTSDEEQVLVKNIAFTFKDRPADHSSNGVTLGIDGWLYLAIGDFGFLDAEGRDGRRLQLRGGGVVRVRTDGSGLELFSRGTRNILEVGLDPLLNGFARDNTNDGGGWDIRLHHFSGMEHHGYPSLFRNFGDEIVAPLADYGGGSGCGALYLSEPGFPAGYNHALYTADWGRQYVYRHHLTPTGATFTADQTEFVGLPRVTDLDVDAMSRLYLASWKGSTFGYVDENVGYLVRLKPKGYQPEPLPDFDKLSGSQLVAELNSASHRRRLAAQRALLRRGIDDDTAQQLTALAADGGRRLEARVAALFALKLGRGTRATAELVRLADAPELREFALRALTDNLEELAEVPSALIARPLGDAQPRVRRQAVASAARLGRSELATNLVPLLADPDALVAHTAMQALVSLRAADVCLAVIKQPDAPAGQRAGALRVLSALHEPRVVATLLECLQHEKSADRRQPLWSALCRLYWQEGPWKGNSWGTRPDTSGPYYESVAWSETSRIAAALKSGLASAEPQEAAWLVAELERHKVQLDGSLATIIAMAGRDPAVVPAAVGQLSRTPRIPAEALPLLLAAARSSESSNLVLSQSVLSLVKTNDPAALEAAIEAVAQLAQRRARSEFDQARDALLNSHAIEQHLAWLEDRAASLDGPAAVWADAILLAASSRGSLSPETRESVAKTLEQGWQQPRRRQQMIEAVRLARFREYRQKVLAALADSDAKVAEAARRTANELRFILPEAARTSGPKIGSLATDAALAAVVPLKGHAAVGEDLFSRLGCVKCHTARADEPLRGPFLGNTVNIYKRRELAEAVLLPSKSIAQGFATNLFVLDDGRTLMGFVVEEAADRVTIRDLEGKQTVIPIATIDDRSKNALSMMPEGLVKEISLYEFASLLDYLQSLATSGKH
jgi:putative membrane-bound dehydrogenase-like protein